VRSVSAVTLAFCRFVLLRLYTRFTATNVRSVGSHARVCHNHCFPLLRKTHSYVLYSFLLLVFTRSAGAVTLASVTYCLRMPFRGLLTLYLNHTRFCQLLFAYAFPRTANPLIRSHSLLSDIVFVVFPRTAYPLRISPFLPRCFTA
jgi:hypothetical protein